MSDGPTPIKLRSVEISGIRGIPSSGVGIRMSNDITIISGANGVGKSSFVAGLRLALTNKLSADGKELKEKNVRNQNSTSQDSLALAKFTTGPEETKTSKWSYSAPKKSRNWTPRAHQHFAKYGDPAPKAIARRLRLTHFLPQGWGGRFQDLSLGDRKELLLSQLQVANLEKGLRSIKRNRRIGRALKNMRQDFEKVLKQERAKSEEWARMVQNWRRISETETDFDVKPKEQLEQDLLALRKDYEPLSDLSPSKQFVTRAREVLTNRKDQTQARLEELEDLRKIVRAIPFLRDTGADLEEVKSQITDRIDQLKQRLKDLKRELQQQAEVDGILVEARERQKHHLKNYASEIERRIDDWRQQSAGLEEMMLSILKNHLGASDTEPEECPVCGATYGNGELRNRLQNRLADESIGDISALEARLETLRGNVNEVKQAYSRAKTYKEGRCKAISRVHQILENKGLDERPLSDFESVWKWSPNERRSDNIKRLVQEYLDTREMLVENRIYARKTEKALSSANERWRHHFKDEKTSRTELDQKIARQKRKLGKISDDIRVLNRTADQLKQHEDADAAKEAWQEIENWVAEEALLLDADEPNNREDFINLVENELSKRENRAQADLNEFIERGNLTEDIASEARSRLERIDNKIIDRLEPIVSDFLKALVPRLDSRIEIRPLKSGPKFEADGRKADRILSAGERNALSLAILFAMHVAFDWCRWNGLVLDDPFQSTDVVRVSAALDVLAGLAKDNGTQILLTTHDDQYAEWCERRGREWGLDVARYSFVEIADGQVELSTPN